VRSSRTVARPIIAAEHHIDLRQTLGYLSAPPTSGPFGQPTSWPDHHATLDRREGHRLAVDGTTDGDVTHKRSGSATGRVESFLSVDPLVVPDRAPRGAAGKAGDQRCRVAGAVPGRDAATAWELEPHLPSVLGSTSWAASTASTAQRQSRSRR
jgi:hypothetical protein